MDSSNVKQKFVSDLLEKDIFELIDLKDLDEANKEKLRVKFTKIIEDNVFANLTNDLIEMKLFDKFQTLDSDEDYDIFFKENNIDMQQYFIEEGLRLKAQLKIVSDLINVGVKPQIKENS